MQISPSKQAPFAAPSLLPLLRSEMLGDAFHCQDHCAGIAERPRGDTCHKRPRALLK